MNILAVTDLYPSRQSPTRGIFVFHSLRSLSEKHNIRLIQPVRNGDPEILEDHGTIVHRVPFREPFFKREFTRAWAMRGGVEHEAMRVSRDFNFDVALGIFTVPGGWLASKIARRHSKPLVVVGLGSDIHFFHKHFILGGMALKTLKMADAVVVNAVNLKNKAVGLGADAEKVAVVPFGYDSDVFHPPLGSRPIHGKGGLFVLMVANLVEVKRPALFVEAAARLVESGTDADFAIAGDGYMRGDLEYLVKERGLENHFVFYGSIPQKDLAELYRKASCVVLTSRSEGLPFSLIESLACGTPVVSSDLPGVREIVMDGVNGRLVENGDPEAFASAIMDVSGWRKSPAEIAESVADRTWSRHAELFGEILERVGGKREPGN